MTENVKENGGSEITLVALHCSVF